MPEPDGQQPSRDRDGDICKRGLLPAGLQQLERLEAEGRERRVAPAKPGHDELSLPGARKQPSVGTAQGAVKSDDERAGDVDEESGPGKARARLNSEREKIACHAAHHAARRDTSIENSRSPAAGSCCATGHALDPVHLIKRLTDANPAATAPMDSATDIAT